MSVSAGETPLHQYNGKDLPRHRQCRRFCCPCRRRRRHREFLLLSFILLVLVSRLVFVYLHFRLSCRTSLADCVSHVGVSDSVSVCVCVCAMIQQVFMSVASLASPLPLSLWSFFCCWPFSSHSCSFFAWCLQTLFPLHFFSARHMYVFVCVSACT